MAKGDRLLALKGLGRQRSAVHRSGALSKALRGCSIAGVPNSKIQQLRMSFLNAGARFKPGFSWELKFYSASWISHIVKLGVRRHIDRDALAAMQ
eukprot:283668-Pyramimonas_sp.AAC.1